jgi:hypothetical protein
MDLTEGSETSAKLYLTPGKYPKENIQVSEHGENLKSRNVLKFIYPEDDSLRVETCRPVIIFK